ncbi:MAG: hypothetical protein OSA83_06015 [Pseudomonadales bacterium]|nr:hypothetical protein [Halioglobus sp.]MDE0988769.1 hypothetical protein [Pseudomonadales bacterium]
MKEQCGELGRKRTMAPLGSEHSLYDGEGSLGQFEPSNAELVAKENSRRSIAYAKAWIGGYKYEDKPY